MKFLVRERKRKIIRNNIRHKLIVSFSTILAIAYCLSCLWLYSRQEVILYRANDKIAHSAPSDRDFQLDFQKDSYLKAIAKFTSNLN